MGHVIKLGGHHIVMGGGNRDSYQIQKKLSFILIPKTQWGLTPGRKDTHKRWVVERSRVRALRTDSKKKQWPPSLWELTAVLLYKEMR